LSVKRPLFVLTLTLGMVPGLFVSRAGVAAAAAWQLVPAPPGTLGELYAVTAVSADDVWAAGRDDNDYPLIEHWDGTSWSVSPTPGLPSNGWLWGISADASNDVWAVGRRTISHTGATAALAERWNGKKWSRIPVPGLTTGQYATNALFGVQALSPSDVWVVGEALDRQGRSRTLVERWNGTHWTIMPAPPTTAHAISLLTPSFGWIAGQFRTRPDAQWRQSSWRTVRTPLAREALFNDVLTESRSSAWGVGQDATTGTPLIEQFRKGSGWTVASTGTTDAGRLESVAEATPGDAWAVGLDSTSSNHNLLIHWDGTSWEPAAGPLVPDFPELLSVTAVPGTDEFWAVGFDGDDDQVIEHYG